MHSLACMEGVGGRWHGLLHVHTPQHPSCAVPAQLALRSLLRTTLHVSTCASTQPVLGVFQKLIASKAHDHEGFNLLSALVSHLDYQAQMAQVGNRCLPLPRAALRSQTAQVGWVLTHQPGLWLAATSRVGENVSAQWSYGGAEEGSACWAGGRTQGSGSGSERAAGARRSVTLEPLCSSSHPPTLLAPAPPPPPPPPPPASTCPPSGACCSAGCSPRAPPSSRARCCSSWRCLSASGWGCRGGGGGDRGCGRRQQQGRVVSAASSFTGYTSHAGK